jgi:ferredoxin--NADP+ reductase
MAKWQQGKVTDIHYWTDDLLSLRFDADIAAFKAGQFVRIGLDIAEERVGRPYSLVNSPEERPLEIFFNIVPGGPLSPRLAELGRGDPLWVTETASGFLVLDEVPDSPHLWMLATGTAIGPFLSILKTEAPWQRFEKIVLAYSVRRVAEMAYRDTISELVSEHHRQLEFVPFVTREPLAGAIQKRIQSAIESRELEDRAGLALTPEQSQVMLCGNSGMITAVSELLAERGMKRHRRREPGHITTEKYH